MLRSELIRRIVEVTPDLRPQKGEEVVSALLERSSLP